MKIGLALGGGGARGLTHIHVIAALEELGLKPSAISGSSIGGLIGAGVAAGMSSKDLEQHFIETFSQTLGVVSRFWSLKPTSWKDLKSRGVRLSQFNLERILEKFLPSCLPRNLDELDIPFCAIAANLSTAEMVVMDNGDLLSALAASASIPGVFRPVLRGGHVLVDGGLCNPVPFDCMVKPVDIVIGVDVVGLGAQSFQDKMPSTLESLLAASLVAQQSLINARFATCLPDLLLRPPVNGIYVLDFLKSKDILERTIHYKETAKYAISDLIECKMIEG